VDDERVVRFTLFLLGLALTILVSQVRAWATRPPPQLSVQAALLLEKMRDPTIQWQVQNNLIHTWVGKQNLNFHRGSERCPYVRFINSTTHHDFPGLTLADCRHLNRVADEIAMQIDMAQQKVINETILNNLAPKKES
jgi:hypothetical protein